MKEHRAARSKLLEALQHQLVPLLEASGFSPRMAKPTGPPDAEIHFAFPLGKYERRHGPDLQLVEIQLDKRGAPKFVLNVGIAPAGGVTLPWGHFDQSVVGVASLTDAYRLYRKPRLQQWFGGGFIPLDIERRAGAGVTQAVAAFDEVENWFNRGVVGPHMRLFGRPRLG